MNVPYTSEKQLAQMIPIEARKYIPVPISEVDLDWKIIPAEAHSSAFMGEEVVKPAGVGDRIDILVAAIHKDVVSKQKEIVSGAGLNLNFLEIEIFSTIRSVAGQDVSVFAVLTWGREHQRYIWLMVAWLGNRIQ